MTQHESDAPEVVAVISYFRDESRYPRAGRASRQDEIYWANIAANTATLRHVTGPGLRVEVHRGNRPPAKAAGLLADAEVHLVDTPFGHQPPEGFFERFAGSLYVLDTMAALADRVTDDTVVLFIDPDIVWVADVAPLIAEVRAHGIVTYDLRIPPDVRSGGLTPRQEAELYEERTGTAAPDPPVHFGGEFYGMLGSRLREVVAATVPVWEDALHRHEQGRIHHNVEEHVLDAVLWELGITEGHANGWLERIMTLPQPFGSRQRYRPELVGWHLPSEKTLGLMRVFDHLAAGRPLPPVGDGFHAWLRRRAGIDRSVRHVLRDLSRWAKWTATGEARDARRRGQVGLGL